MAARVATLLSLLLCLPQVALAQQLLRWNYQPGQELKMLVKMELTIESPAAPAGFDADVQYYTTQRVVEKDSLGNFLIETTFDRIVFELDSPQGKVKYDSADENMPKSPVAQAFAQAAAPLLGKAIRIKLSPRGEVLDFQVPDELKQQGPFGNIANPQEFARQLSLPLPESAVDVGEQWKQELTTKSPMGTITTTALYTYRGPTTYAGVPCYRIDVTFEIKSQQKADAPVQVQIKSVDSKGVLYISQSMDRIVYGETEMSMETELTFGGQKQTQRTITKTTVSPIAE